MSVQFLSLLHLQIGGFFCIRGFVGIGELVVMALRFCKSLCLYMLVRFKGDNCSLHFLHDSNGFLLVVFLVGYA